MSFTSTALWELDTVELGPAPCVYRFWTPAGSTKEIYCRPRKSLHRASGTNRENDILPLKVFIFR